MRPTLFIDQNAGLGDILFIQKIIDRIINDGYDVLLPVVHEYKFIKDYIKKEHLNISIIDANDRHTRNYIKNITANSTLPLHKSYDYYPHMNMMAAKYQMLRMNYDNWQNHFTIIRNYEKENKLVEQLGTRNKKYNLICNTLCTPPDQMQLKMDPVDNGLEKINISIIDEYSPFDWGTVIENATNLYFVDTSFTYIIEKLTLKAENMFLYSRWHNDGGVHSSLQTMDFWSKPWKLYPVKSF